MSKDFKGSPGSLDSYLKMQQGGEAHAMNLRGESSSGEAGRAGHWARCSGARLWLYRSC